MSNSAKVMWVMAAVALALGAPHVAAQTASLTGVVTDPSGLVVPAVKITATQVQTSLSFSTNGDETGHYLLPNLPIGLFTVTAETAGFKRFTQTGVELTVDLRALLNVKLEVGDMAERIEVAGEASRVDVQTATIQDLVDSRHVLDLPINGRDVYQLAKLVPGTGSSGLNINGGRAGQRSTTANVRLDGAMNVEQNLLTVLPSPSPDAVQEFTIQTSVPSAKYGYAAGVIEIATKSGTNQLHGTFYDFFRNDALDARSFFSPNKTRRRRNQYGAAAGGPVWLPRVYNGRNRTFWFVNVERQREVLGAVTTIFDPTATELQGDFSGLGRTVTDPLTNQAFPNNQIPVARLDPLALNIIKKFVPLGQGTNGSYTYQAPSDNNPSQVLARVDHTQGLNQFTWRTYITRITSPSAFGNLPYFDNGISFTHTGVHTLTFTRILTPKTINVFRFSYNSWHAGAPDSGPNGFTLNDLRAMGWSQNYYDYTTYFPAMAVSGFFNVSTSLTHIVRGSNTFTWEDDLSLLRGKHTIQAGARVMRANQNDGDAIVRSMGSYTFNGAFTGSALTDFMLGRPSFFEQQNEQFAATQATTVGLYVQDDIRASKRLTLNIGVRYELPLAPFETAGTVMVFKPGSTERSTKFKNAPPGLLFLGDPGVTKSGRATPSTLFGPRVGFSYALTSDQKTVLRAGWGVFYNPTWLNVEAQYDNKPPWVNRIGVTPPASTANPWANYPGGNPFPSPSGDPNYVFQNAGIFSYAPNYTEPNMQQWNINVQRELAKNFLVTGAYVGSKGTHLLLRTDENAAKYIPGQSTLANLDARRPFFSPLTTIEWITSGGNSTYHSAQFTLNKRFSKGFSVLSSYTFSKSLDWQSDGFSAFPQDPNNYAAEHGPSTWDRTHAFVNSWVWQIPTPASWRGIAAYVLGNWAVNGILSMYSGTPLMLAESVDRALRGLTNRPDRLRDARLSSGRPRAALIAKYFDTSAYVPNQTGQFGSAPRTESQLRGPGTVELDVGTVKRFRITESHRLEFRGEFINLPNRPNFSNPGTNIDSSASFGRITAAGDGRVIQLGLKYMF
jgi:hypothetical protein